MGQISRCLRRTSDGYSFWCPGCREMHQVWTDRAERPCWTFDGNVEHPTFTPSLLITGKQIEQDAQGNWTGEWIKGPDGKALDHVCHSFVTAGRLLFLADCTHVLKGQTVDLPDLPQWAIDNREDSAMADNDTSTANLTDEARAALIAGDKPEGASDSSAQDSDKADSKSVQSFDLKIDAKAIEEMAAQLKQHVDDGLAALKGDLREEFSGELKEFADHFEQKLESVLRGMDGLDPDKLNEVLAAIRDSGAADLAARLTRIEGQIKHMV